MIGRRVNPTNSRNGNMSEKSPERRASQAWGALLLGAVVISMLVATYFWIDLRGVGGM